MSKNSVISISYFEGEGDWRYKQDWIQKIQTRLAESKNQKLKQNFELHWNAGCELSKRAVSVEVKAQMVFSVIEQLKDVWNKFTENLKENRQEVEELFQQESVAYNKLPYALKYQLLTNFDSLIFEVRSYLDILVRFMESFQNNILEKTVYTKRKDIDQNRSIILEEIIELFGENNWFSDLRTHRNDFIHEKTPDLGIEMICQSNRKKFLPAFFRYISENENPEIIRHKNLNRFLEGIESLSLNGLLFNYFEGKIQDFEKQNSTIEAPKQKG